MLNKKLENAEVTKLCRQCAKARKKRGEPCHWVEQENSFCEGCITLDNSLSWFKKYVVNENSGENNKELEIKFSQHIANNEKYFGNNDFINL